jgi:hypothetical protein
VPKQLSTGDRTILGSISKRGNRYLRSLFVQAAWVVLVKIGPNHWDRYPYVPVSKQRTHSLFRQGAMLYELIQTMPEPRLRPIERFGAMLLEIPMFAGVYGTI